MGFDLHKSESLTGLVLVAAPELVDPNFNHSLVYVAEHGPQGSLGMVINRPLGKALHEVVVSPDLPDALRDVRVFQGGPVKPSALVFVRFERGTSDEELGCKIVADPEALIVAPKRGVWVRAFAGYAGWGEGQLEQELSERSWIVRRPHTAMLEEPVPPALWEAFISDDQRWRRLLPLLPKNTSLN
jgi:putative transcriptional regulator